MVGIEKYAKMNHHFPPIFSKWIYKFLFSSFPKNEIKVSPENEIRILFFKKLIIIKKKKPNSSNISDNESHKGKNIRQKDIDWRNDYFTSKKAEEILNTRIPKKYRINIDFDLDLFIKSVNWAYIFITRWHCLPSGRISSEKVTIGGKKLKKITTTPCFMFLNLQIWGRGILNYPGYHCGNSFDLSTPKGMSLLLHEIYHIYQFRKNPIALLWQYIKSLRNSLVFDKVLFSHARIHFEIEAIAFEQEILKELKKDKWASKLRLFRQLR